MINKKYLRGLILLAALFMFFPATAQQPPKAKLDKIASLKPAFREGGTVTAANSSSISDGAAALVLMRQSQAQKLGLKPLAVIHGHAAFADTPGLFPVAPIGAIKKLIKKTGWSLGDVNLPGPAYEVRAARSLGQWLAQNKLDADKACWLKLGMQEGPYRAVFEKQEVPTSMRAGETAWVSITVRNLGPQAWHLSVDCVGFVAKGQPLDPARRNQAGRAFQG